MDLKVSLLTLNMTSINSEHSKIIATTQMAMTVGNQVAINLNSSLKGKGSSKFTEQLIVVIRGEGKG